VTEYLVRPIGWVRGGRQTTTDDHWGAVRATIELDPAVVGPNATLGLEEFSHLEVVFLFDRVDPATVTTGARHPRGDRELPLTGILAQRGKARPNRLGVSRCTLLGISGTTVEVVGLDAIDGTPVLDLKPWMEEFAPIGEVRQPGWVAAVMADYFDEAEAP
jgi:tRNA (adenine37-N6)-methyltransferase